MPAHHFLRINLNRKAKDSRKSYCSQNTQCIFRESFIWVSYGTNHLSLAIPATSERVHQSPIFVVCHGIDGKIPAGQVFLNRVEKLHSVGVPAVCIYAIICIEDLNLDGMKRL